MPWLLWGSNSGVKSELLTQYTAVIWPLKDTSFGVPVMAQQWQTQPVSMRIWVWSLASLSGLGSGFVVSCGVGRRCSAESMLLWLWCRPAAKASIWPLAWEFPYAEVLSSLPKRHIFCYSLFDILSFSHIDPFSGSEYTTLIFFTSRLYSCHLLLLGLPSSPLRNFCWSSWPQNIVRVPFYATSMPLLCSWVPDMYVSFHL